MPEISCAVKAENICGECPVWNQDEEALYWIDIRSKTMNRYAPSTGLFKSWNLPEEIYSFAFRENGGLVAAAESGFVFLDLDKEKIEQLGNPEPDLTENRLNDGKCDPIGRFWAGSMHIPRSRNAGLLYRLDPDLTWHRIADGVMVGNGLAWSPDGRTMYWSDSRNQIIYSFDYDISKGTTGNRRVFARLSDNQGRPDGAAVDCEGYYWTACFNGGRVIRFSPQGRIDREIPFPVTNVTMCTFGGPELRTMYVTTARLGLSDEELHHQPLAGSLLAMEVDVPGLPASRFKG